ncbi:MAG: B12-binding domain-containing radical SAM protein [Candidatus Thorarchaeota archaeon]|jgi:radical SAM superfamily enzyme YgiQ (UPF0313 family)
MKIAFINLSLRPGAERRQLPVGLAYVMTAVKRMGFDFDLIDMDIDNLSLEDLEQMLSRTTYDVYALGCIVTGFKLVKQVADIIKETRPDSIVIAGNSVASSIPELLLQHTKVDIAVLGEGDIILVELLRVLDGDGDQRAVKGIAFKENGKVMYTPAQQMIAEIDSLGFPDWNIFDLSKYNEYGRVNYNILSSEAALGYPLNSARGCPYSCTFCYHVFKGKRYRRYSVDAIIEEIKRLHNVYGANYVSFWDELTFPNVRSVRTLLNRLSDLDFSIGWDGPCRGDLFKKEHVSLVREMKEAGCDNISFSLENASPEILVAMNKKLTVDQFIEQAETLWKGGVVPLTSVIFGYPQETPETIQRTIDVCERCNMFPSVGFLLPLPGTEIYEWAKENGYINDEVVYLEIIGDRQDFHINLTTMTDEQFVEEVRSKLEKLAVKLGLELESVFKTTTYQKPKK